MRVGMLQELGPLACAPQVQAQAVAKVPSQTSQVSSLQMSRPPLMKTLPSMRKKVKLCLVKQVVFFQYECASEI